MTAIPSRLPTIFEAPNENLQQMTEYKAKLAQVRSYLLQSAQYIAGSKMASLVEKGLEILDKKEEELNFKIRVLRIIKQVYTE